MGGSRRVSRSRVRHAPHARITTSVRWRVGEQPLTDVAGWRAFSERHFRGEIHAYGRGNAPPEQQLVLKPRVPGRTWGENSRSAEEALGR